MSGLDTIDIEDLANQFGEDFVSMNTQLAMGALITQAPFLVSANVFAPLAKTVLEDLIRFVIRYVGNQGGLILKSFNTTVFTTDQGKDYIASVIKRRELPEDVSDEVWAEAEEEANHAMRNLINYRR